MRGLIPAAAEILGYCGLAAMAPAAFYGCLRQGPGASWAACLAASLCLLALLLFREPRRPWLCLALASAAAFASGTLALAAIGERRTEFLAALFMAAGLLGERGRTQPRVWLWGLAAAGAAVWTRCLALMTGNSVYAWTWVVCALSLGAGAGLWTRERWRALIPNESLAAALPGALMTSAGLFGLLFLHFLRFIGINAGAGEYLQAPLGTPFDLLFIAGQACAALALRSALLAASAGSAAQENGPRTRLARGFACLWGPALAGASLSRLGPATSAVLLNLLLIAAGLLRLWRHAPWRAAALAKTAGAALALAAFLCLGTRDAFLHIWINRLNSAYPGGRFLALHDDGAEALGVYEFSTGEKILVRDGAAQYNTGLFSKQEAHLPLLLLAEPRSALLVAERSPVTIDAALSHGVRVDVLDPHRASRDNLKLLATRGWRPPEARLSFLRGGRRAALRAAATRRYDMILVELPVPAHAPEAAFWATLEFLRGLGARLSPHGLLAVSLSAPYFEDTLPILARTAERAFPHVVLLRLPGGVLVCASEDPIEPSPAAMASRRTDEARFDDPSLAGVLAGGLPWLRARDLPNPRGVGAQDDDRAAMGFPLRAIFSGRPTAVPPAM